jgi:hypothetical protein
MEQFAFLDVIDHHLSIMIIIALASSASKSNNIDAKELEVKSQPFSLFAYPLAPLIKLNNNATAHN